MDDAFKQVLGVEKMECTDCGKEFDSFELEKIEESYQEYAGGAVWTDTHYLCKKCLSKHPFHMPRGIQENTRGW